MFALLVWTSLADARPTDGAGMWTYDDSDTVASLDGPVGLVRVWYSTTGTNAVLPDDLDQNGLPDFAEDVAATSEEVLVRLEELGVRLPLPDAGEGGDDRLDAYLVDFGGSSDGNWSSEDCDREGACSGYFQMENDFSGYGYPSLHTAVTVLTSHELFHGVQAAYGASEAVWFSEGTATWAEDYFAPESEDFLDLCGAYLKDTSRSLSEPPAGPVPAFAYGTAIWWWFLTDRYGDAMMNDLLEAMATADNDDALLAAMAELQAGGGGDLRTDFTTFTQWNLATAARAGGMESYPFAGDLFGLTAAIEGPSIVDESRFYPLSATYYVLESASESELFVATSAAGPDLSLAVNPEDAGGNVLAALAEIPADGQSHSLGVLPAGDYWLVVANPTLAANSTKLTVCFGAAVDMEACAEPGGDTADTDDKGDTAADTGDGSEAGCACGSTRAPSFWAVTAGMLAALAGRRRAPERRSKT